MPKGIRKACANCIKSRLACDEGRPCQRCIVHQCECVPVARKPRVKKQKVEPVLDSTGGITLSWIQTDQSSFTASSDTENLTKISVPSPSPPPSPSPSHSPLPLSPPQQASLPQLPPPLPLSSSEPLVQPTPTEVPQQFTPSSIPQLDVVPPPNTQPQPQQYENPMSPTQMLSLLLDDKPSALMQEWPDMLQFSDFASGTQAMKEFLLGDDSCCTKKTAAPPAPLPQPKNSTPLFPSPIGIFDKQRFMLLDANAAMAELFGCANVAEFASLVQSLDDIVDPAAAHVAKNSTSYFISSMPFDRLGVFRTRSGGTKTVEFRVELTEQLVIFSVKSVYDDCSMALPEVQPPVSSIPDKAATSPIYKPLEFLSPID